MPATFDETVVAPTFQGNLTGNSTGAHIGGVTGNVVGNLTGNVAGNVNGGTIPAGTNVAGDGALVIPSAEQEFYITKGSIATLTIAAPAAGTDDFKTLWIRSETAFAHVITCSTDGFNAKGSSGTLTFGAAAGNSVIIRARNGHWWVYALNGVTVA